jgi:hypothetical protein
MSDRPAEICVEALRNLRRTLELLHLSGAQPSLTPTDRAWLQGACAKISIACSLLEESAAQPGTLVSTKELILKAEISLAAMDLALNDLSLRIADSLLLQTRVRIENLTGQTY